VVRTLRQPAGSGLGTDFFCSVGGLPASEDPMALVEPKKEDTAETENGIVKANKGMILRKSVEYIR
jgi:hypothetical protein